MNFSSMQEVLDAERACKAERMAAGRYVRIDESKTSSAKDVMHLRRLAAAAAEQSEAWDAMLSERDTNRLFLNGAWWLEPPPR